MKRIAGAILSFAVAAAAASAAFAQGYPDRPVKIVVPFAPAGPTDVIARIVADKLSISLGKQFYVENRAGAGGNTGTGQVATSPRRWLHADRREHRLRGQSEPVRQGPLRSVKDFAPISDGRRLAQRHDRASLRAGEDRQGAGRAGEGQSRQVQLRGAGRRQHAASFRRDLPHLAGHRHGHGAVHRRRPRDPIDAWRPHAGRVHRLPAGRPADQGRQAARADGDEREARSKASRTCRPRPRPGFPARRPIR